MSQLPSPTGKPAATADVFRQYLDFFRDEAIAKAGGLSAAQQRTSVLPSGWTPLELLKHLAAMERRWLVWGFLGEPVDDPFYDWHDDRWAVGPDESLDDLVEALRTGAELTRQILAEHQLSEVGAASDRWEGDPPATLERVLFHVFQEYARHLGHLDIVRELSDGQTGEE